MQTLRLFADVARCHSFSQAAARHGVTQSAASQRVNQLERRLGVTLIDRSVRPLRLTEAGQAFLAGCDDIIQRYDRLERQLRINADEGDGSPSNLVGMVRVGAIYSAGIDLLSHVRDRFEAKYPRVHVEIRYDRPDRVHQAVRDGDCDFGILSYPQRWSKVAVTALRDETMVVVCHPGHPLANRQTVQAADLAGYEMAAFEPDLPVGRAIRRYLKEHDRSAGSHGSTGPRIASEFDNIDTIKAAVAVTDQVAILPRRTVIREVEARTLAMVELEPRLTRPMGIIYRPSGRGRRGRDEEVGPPSTAVRTFIDFLIDHAGPDSDIAKDSAGQQVRQGELVGERA